MDSFSSAVSVLRSIFSSWSYKEKIAASLTGFLAVSLVAFFSVGILSQRQKAIRNAVKLKKPLEWVLLHHFRGTLYHKIKSSYYSTNSKLVKLHAHAISTELYVQSSAMHAFSLVAEAAEKRMPRIAPVDIRHILVWRSRPGPVISHRIPLFLGLLALNHDNRAALRSEATLKTFIADARSAAARKRFSAAIAIAVATRDPASRQILMGLQVLDVLISLATSSRLRFF